jgi:hypothetical protein
MWNGLDTTEQIAAWLGLEIAGIEECNRDFGEEAPEALLGDLFVDFENRWQLVGLAERHLDVADDFIVDLVPQLARKTQERRKLVVCHGG